MFKNKNYNKQKKIRKRDFEQKNEKKQGAANIINYN